MTQQQDGRGAATVEFFFDPVCPWTWNTSRWLVAVAAVEGLAVTWRSLSLAVVNRDRDVPEQYVAPMAAGKAALRLLEALRAAGRGDEVGPFYTELGRRFHHDDAPRTVDEVRAAAEVTGVADLAEATDDTSWDDTLVASVEEAQGLVGDDLGSPILVLGPPRRGFFGPIVSPPPSGEEAVLLWHAVRDLATVTGFAELKRGRSGPLFGPRP